MRNKLLKRGGIYLVLVLLVGLFATCVPTKEVKEVASFPIEVTDQLGRVVSLEKVPERIISLAPSNTEILFALGLGEMVIAVTEYCNYPPEAQEKPKIGGYTTVDIESVVALEPDLILATQFHNKTVIPAIEKVGLTAFALAPETLDEVLASIATVGEVTGNSQEANRLVTSLEERIKVVTDKTKALVEKPRVLYLTWHDPLFTAGLGTIHHDLINKAGGENIAQDLLGHKTIDLETVIQRNPQVIIVNRGHGEAKDLPFSYVKNELRLGVTEALIAGRVYQIDADIMDRPGPRVVDALEQLVKSIHPELFGMREEAK